MRRSVTVGLCLALSLVSTSASAETIWERAKYGDLTDEKQTRASVERVLLGTGDERDLFRVRVALITLSRGEITDPRTIVLLLRLRREMGLSTVARTPLLLDHALQGGLGSMERAWAELERAHFLSESGELDQAIAALSRGLDSAWRTSVRAETLVLRGLISTRRSDPEAALADFDEVVRMDSPRRLIVQAQVGRAFAYALRGDARRVSEQARRAFVTESTRATVSRLDPFWDLRLSSRESRGARALLHWGKAETLQLESPSEAHATRLQACSLVKWSGQQRHDPAEFEMPWGKAIVATLAALWQKQCLLPPPSTSGNDEDDF